MVQYKAITRGLRADQVAAELAKDVQEFKRDVMISTAEVIAQTSPVDTGTYARNHRVMLRSGSFVPRVQIPENAPRKVPPGPPRSEGLARMMADIAALDLSKNTFVFRNEAVHSPFVEARNNVYSAARADVYNAVQTALNKLRGGV